MTQHDHAMARYAKGLLAQSEGRAAEAVGHYRRFIAEQPDVSAIFAAKLQNNGQTVDYALPWDVGHGGDYDLDELFAWMKQVSSSAK